ncbi:RNA-binding protein 33 isoform X2 [Cephus cinctus]|uniref:RNA-binding protein 33 isoform X2 n=1 Tax=Cephus cinctus TaxID=211228 RepID=A0AAJ7FNZ6_CEPCN|nr:RNA-binding protein 33 isoform X2 [Cephus cinctus]
MSDHDDTLLDEDLGDEEYDLGNDEEEALLADDYELERQSSYKGEEETDDVLDLGVTDALDDLEGEDENIEYRSETDNRIQNDFYKEEHPDAGSTYYEQEEQEEYKEEQNRQYEDSDGRDCVSLSNNYNKGDLREKLKNNSHKEFYVGNGQGLEDDDCEEAKERRNRFQNERTMISPKMNNDIPDSLENVVTAEQPRQLFRGRGRGRGIRGIRGGRFAAPTGGGNFIPRFNAPRGPSSFENQHPSFRSPLLGARPSFPTGGPIGNMPNQQMPYPQNNSQLSSMQQFSSGSLMQNSRHFVGIRSPLIPNQFQGPMGPPGSRISGLRISGPRTDFNSRGPMLVTIPAFNCSSNQPPFMHNQPHFQNQGLSAMSENQGRPNQGTHGPPMQGNPGPLMHGNPGLLIPGNQGPIMQGNQGPPMQGNRGPPMQGNQGPTMQGNQGPPMQGNQGPPMQRNQGLPMQGNQGPSMPRNQGPPMQQFSRPSGPNQGPSVQSHENPPIQHNQPSFENRPPFQGAHFESRPIYESRPMYNDQPPDSQFNNVPAVPQQPGPNVTNIPNIPNVPNVPNTPTISNGPNAPNVPNLSSVPLPPGHKILINPHFRGVVQPTSDARLVWDAAHPQSPLQPQIPNEQFIQPPTPYQNPSSYNQGGPTPQQGSQEYRPKLQQNKSDDPYAYFSDVWQENKPQKSSSTVPSKPYPGESTYSSRETSYHDYENKYKPDSQWDHRDDYQQDQRRVHSYYERVTTREEHIQKSRVPSMNTTYRSESYEQSHSQRPPSNRTHHSAPRGMARIPGKRIPDASDRTQRDVSPKRAKSNSRNLYEVKTVDTLSEVNSEKKEEENDDPEMREYREKMEEQKRLREKLLREKENRRKLAAKEKQGEDGKPDSGIPELMQQECKPVSVVTGVTKESTLTKVRPTTGRGRGRPTGGGPQSTEIVERAPGMRIVRTIQTVQQNTTDENPKEITTVQNDAVRNRQQLTGQPGTRRVVIHKPLSKIQKGTTTIQKTIPNLQKGAIKNPTGVVQKVVVGNVQRIVAQKVQSGLQKTTLNVQEIANANVQKVMVNTQNNQRVVLQKTGAQPKKTLDMKTNTVKIENLAASTTEAQIRRMCHGIGTLESIRMAEGSATIVFKTQSAALAFHKKYQRKMLDLSLITVRLVPQASVNKAVATVTKKS